VQAHWNAALQTLEGHLDSVWSVAFSPDGQRVVSGSYDETVRLWDAATGALQQTLEGHSSGVTSVAFSSDGRVHSLFVLDEWIAEGGVNFLWLPPDYRITSTATWNNSIILGHSLGNISFLKFTLTPKVI
jgi:WD40 repeat protein